MDTSSPPGPDLTDDMACLEEAEEANNGIMHD